jgi:hypothetical protein
MRAPREVHQHEVAGLGVELKNFPLAPAARAPLSNALNYAAFDQVPYGQSDTGGRKDVACIISRRVAVRRW